MPFPRQRHDGTNETHPLTLSHSHSEVSTSSADNSSIDRIANYLPGQSSLFKNLFAGAVLLTGAGLLSQSPAVAKPKEKLNGVWAWTTGSQTYFRARPSALTPAVAKVPRSTKVFVWGKFDGWYRVESPDHKFGWVYHDYLNCPKGDKVEELSHAKAKLASDRTENQTMYGSPAMLKRHYAKYKAPGAARGLEQQGVRLVSHKPKVAPVKVAKTTPQQPVRPVAWPAPKTVAVAAPRVAAPRAVAVAAKPALPVVETVAPVENRTVVTVASNENPAASRISPAAPPVAVKKPVVVAKAKPAPAKAATPKPQARVAMQPRPHQLSSREMRRNQREYARAQKRNVLRAKLGSNVMAQPAKIVPPLATGGLRPLSPAEVMQAREAFLASQKPKTPEPAVVASEPSIDDGVAIESNAPAATITPSSQNWNLADDAKNYLKLDLNSNAPQAMNIQIAHEVKAPAKAAPVNRGGSPRDYARQSNKNSFGQSMANQALGYRGMPYIRGAESPNRGFDCSGLVYYLLRQRGYNPPRTASELASYGKPVPRNQLQAGDILLFANTYHRGVSHVGIYMGNNKFVHAANSSKGVRVDSLSTKYYMRKYYGARRVK